MDGCFHLLEPLRMLAECLGKEGAIHTAVFIHGFGTDGPQWTDRGSSRCVELFHDAVGFEHRHVASS
eukprot:jgi/Pico_ML_1/50717/g1876.t1